MNNYKMWIHLTANPICQFHHFALSSVSFCIVPFHIRFEFFPVSIRNLHPIHVLLLLFCDWGQVIQAIGDTRFVIKILLFPFDFSVLFAFEACLYFHFGWIQSNTYLSANTSHVWFEKKVTKVKWEEKKKKKKM